MPDPIGRTCSHMPVHPSTNTSGSTDWHTLLNYVLQTQAPDCYYSQVPTQIADLCHEIKITTTKMAIGDRFMQQTYPGQQAREGDT